MQATQKHLSHWFVLLLSAATGVCVASNYYAQPLLHTISHDLAISSSSVGIVITIAQLSYALGLVLLVPLGDLVERRKLIVSMFFASMSGLIISATAQNITWLLIGTSVSGFFAVVAQMIIPFAASLASPSERGQVVGTIMSGLLLGILLAKTAAGICSDLGSWRTIYLVAAITLFIINLLLLKTLPRSPASFQMNYLRLLASTLGQFITYPRLILYAFLGALNFATFSILWTPIAFVLANKPYFFNDTVIGLFGLAGAAGALFAPYVGKLADKGKSNLVITLGFLLLIGSWLPLYFSKFSLILLIIGIVLLDLAVQTAHVTCMNQVYQLNQASRNRLNACYMVSYFIGGALGSFGSMHIFTLYNWSGVVMAGTCTALLALIIWLIFYPQQNNV